MSYGQDTLQSNVNMQVHAAALLVATGAFVELSAADARQIVAYMTPQLASAGDVLIREGDTQDGFMALILEGEVTVENELSAAADTMVMTVLGAGALIGEMSLIDRSPRSATCTAATDLLMAVLTYETMQRILRENPSLAARLILAIAARVVDHLRETNRKLMTFAQVAKALQSELEAAHGVNQRLLDEQEKTSRLTETQQMQTRAESRHP